MSAMRRRSDSFPHQSTLEALYGEDLSGAQVSTNESSGLSSIAAGGLSAGDSIAVPSSTPTLELMAHEVAHYLQNQKAGSAPTQLASIPGDAAEMEAKGAESKALAGEPISISAAPTGLLQGDWLTGAGIGAAVGSLLGPVGTVAGGVVGGLIQDAMSDDEEQAPAPKAPEPEPAKEEPKPEKLEGSIEDQAADNEDVYQGKHKVAPGDTKLGDLSTEEARMKLLGQFSQNTSKDLDPDGGGYTRCGATSIMAAAIAGGGQEGIDAVLEQVKNGLDPKSPEYDAMKERLEAIEKNKKDGLTMADLHSLTYAVHADLSRRQFEASIEHGWELPAEGGIGPGYLKEFIDENDTLRGYFKKGNMSIDSVDGDGNGNGRPGEGDADHFVLRMKTGDGEAVFDPMAQKGGSQVYTDKAHLDLYDRHEYKPDQIDGRTFNGTGY